MTWDELLDAVSREVATSVERTVERMRTLSSYADLSSDALRAVVRRNHDAILAGMRLRRPPKPDDATAIFGQQGEVRARQAVAVSDMLAAWRIGQESLYLLASGSARAGADQDALLREFLELEISWVDFAMLAAAEGHRRAELSLAREQQHVQANLIRRVMSGAAAPAEVRSAFASLGLEPEARYHAVRARRDPQSDAHAVDRYLGVDVPVSSSRGIAALIDGDVWGILERLPHAPAPVAVGASDAVGIAELEHAFRHATRALEAAVAIGAKGVFDLETLGLQAAVVGDADVGDAMLSRYVRSLDGVAGGEVVLETVERFLDNDRSAEVTARELGVHVNTIRHRLSRFEEVTGRSLRETETVVEVWWALQRRRVG